MAKVSMSSQKQIQQAFLRSMTIGEKLKIPFSMLAALITIPYVLISALLPSGQKRPPTLLKYVIYSVFRRSVAANSIKQFQSIFAPTEDVFTAKYKKVGVEPVTEQLVDGTTAFWIGSKTAENVILYFHGGGYCLAPSPECIDNLFDIQERCTKTGKNVAMLVLAYDLASTHPYPRQLQQAASMLNHVLTSLDYQPSNLILGGDSAGGNLVLAILSHISHPHPDESIPRVNVSSKFRGIFLVSPWVSFDTSTPSFTANASSDSLPAFTLEHWSSTFLGTSPSDQYSEPVRADAEWWRKTRSFVDDVLIVAGKDELLLDGIEAFVANFENGVGSSHGAGGSGGKITSLMLEGVSHDAWNIDRQLGFGKGRMGEVIEEWVLTCL